MKQFKGIAVSPGAAIGESLVIDFAGIQIPRRLVAADAVDAEMARLERAVDRAAAEITRNRDQVSAELGDQCGAIFAAHLQVLHDPRLRDEIETLVRQQCHCAEFAVSEVFRRYVRVFENLGNRYLADRANDILDIEQRLLANLLGERREAIARLSSPALVLAHNLTPSETANLDRQFVMGFATEAGGPGSHTAIVAEGMEIPAVVGIGAFLSEVTAGDTVIVDGNAGVLVLNPDEATLAEYRRQIEAGRKAAVELERLRNLPAETADGVRVEIHGTIEFPHEVRGCTDRGADGIGLYRTEFLYLGSKKEPSEQVHFEAYQEVLAAVDNRPVIIRTLDLGADKMAHLPEPEEEHNPFLGVRSIRLSLRNLDLFRTQLRAILRASVLGDVRMMFPLVTTVSELRQAKAILADVREDLDERGIDYDRDISVGMMVEVPSAVMMIDEFVREVDFISIGANDLIQYALAVDRSNKDVAHLYNASDPAVLRLIQIAAAAARARQIPVYVCGQMSSSKTYTMLLLGLGVRHLSVAPGAIPMVKQICRSVRLDLCEAVAARAMAMENAADIKRYLREELRKYVPEVAD